ncbi:hypothetical protein F4780DRAFT_777062 [Xylariomycetidae sp. FL0641]|nr:hypothetical protein F4780DRAFT_777062 [Xylariomycetidae sp. FL0641]
MAEQKSKSTLYIGIDFGTTFSGVSWLYCRDKSVPRQCDVQVVTRWLSLYARNSDRQKVPSRISYDDEGRITWGYNIPADAEPIQWFKLLLLKSDDLPSHLRGSPHVEYARAKLDKLDKTAVQVVGDYLKQLWKHIMEEIETEKGCFLIRRAQIRVVMTVPAIWKDYARDLMRQAAKDAGILESRPAGETTLSFVSEPEAAALATLPELDGREDLEVGDSFVVVDAGGGTVDIISYIVNQAEPLQVSECVEGDGALCGATFLDQDFGDFLKKRVGSEAWEKLDPSDIKKMMNNEWEHGIKCDFDGTERPYVVDLPKRGKRGQLKITTDEILKVFDGVLSRIYALVSKQLDAIKAKTQQDAKFVILVGGFGRCPYLFRSLKKRHGCSTDVLQARSERPWSAVCRGATLSGALGHGLTKQAIHVRSRIARLSYGWCLKVLFVNGTHDERDRLWNDVRGIWQARNQMNWVIKKGDSIKIDQPVTMSLCRTFALDRLGVQDISDSIYVCADEIPPARREDSVIELKDVRWKTPLAVEGLPVRYQNGRSFHSLDFDFKLKVSGAALEFSVIHDDVIVGSRGMEIEYA